MGVCGIHTEQQYKMQVTGLPQGSRGATHEKLKIWFALLQTYVVHLKLPGHFMMKVLARYQGINVVQLSAGEFHSLRR